MQSRARMPQKQLKKPSKKFSLIPFLILFVVLLVIILVYWHFKARSSNLDSFTVVEQNTSNITYEEQENLQAMQDSVIETPVEEPLVTETELVAEPEQDIKETPEIQQSNEYTANFSDKYDSALKLFYATKYQQAMDIFLELKSQYPEHSFQVNCQHWIGECYFGLENYTNALAAFQKVLTFGKTYKTDDALLMIGRSYQKMGDKINARLYYNRLLNEYPNSEYLDKAQWHMSRL